MNKYNFTNIKTGMINIRSIDPVYLQMALTPEENYLDKREVYCQKFKEIVDEYVFNCYSEETCLMKIQKNFDELKQYKVFDLKASDEGYFLTYENGEYAQKIVIKFFPNLGYALIEESPEAVTTYLKSETDCGNLDDIYDKGTESFLCMAYALPEDMWAEDIECPYADSAKDNRDSN